MSNQLSALLALWLQHRDETEWVLGTVYRTEGSAYSKAGTMMLINGKGQQFGLLSGGCIQADIARNARKAIVTGQTVMLVYDGSDEDDLSFRLGIGCGGTVYIMLQPVTTANDLDLSSLHAALSLRHSGFYRQKIGDVISRFEPDHVSGQSASWIENHEDGDWLVTPVLPEPHILVVGGGVDARPVVNIALEMGWQVTLVDPRSANARREHFPPASNILRTIDHSLATYVQEKRIEAAILMAHSVTIDARALAILSHAPLRYLAALGPRHRFADILQHAGIRTSDLPFAIASPAGLPIGGRLPESIALSILAGVHSALFANQST